MRSIPARTSRLQVTASFKEGATCRLSRSMFSAGSLEQSGSKMRSSFTPVHLSCNTSACVLLYLGKGWLDAGSGEGAHQLLFTASLGTSPDGALASVQSDTHAAPIFWRGCHTTRPNRACRAAHQARGENTRLSEHDLRSAKTLKSSHPKGLTRQPFFQTNTWKKLSSTSSNSAEGTACVSIDYRTIHSA